MKLLRTNKMEFYDNQAKENPSNTRVIFRTAYKGEVRNIISTSLPKSCSPDQLSTSLLRENIAIILACITNKSITSDCFPSIYNTAQVIPILKKSSLDTDIMKNYPPVSNLPFVSKVVMKVAANTHMAQNSILEPA